MCGLFSGHHWEKWVDIGRGNILVNGIRVGFWVRQERRCLLCGKIQLRVEKEYGN